MASFFSSPTSLQNNKFIRSMGANEHSSVFAQTAVGILKTAGDRPPPHSSHPAFGHLVLLVFEAVLEVVCVSLPGYIVARQGMFDAEAQKFVANLNVALFTPCLIFTKLASQLTADKLGELAVIPVIFIVQTLVSYVCSIGISKAFGFGKRPANFVTAMGVSSDVRCDFETVSAKTFKIGFRQLQLAPHLACYLVVTDLEGLALG